MPLRLLHLADLHAGKITARVLNRNRDLEKILFGQVLSFIESYPVDYLVVAGDIFNKAVPDAESEHLIYSFLVRVGRLGVKTLLVAGNHDSPRKLLNIVPWGGEFKVKVFPSVDPKNPVYADGEVAFVNVPFVSERKITELEGGNEAARLKYAELMRKYLSHAAERAKPYRYRILTAHLFFDGSKLGLTEREITVADTYAVPQSAIPEVFHYAALGHVHKYQRLEGAKIPAYYVGSPYQLDFGEAGEEKYFNYAVIDERGNAEVEKIKIEQHQLLKKIVVDSEGKLKNLNLSGNAYYWVILKTGEVGKAATLREKVERLLGEKLLKLSVEVSKKVGVSASSRKVEGEILKNPVEMYRLYLRENGKILDKETERLLREALQRVEL